MQRLSLTLVLTAILCVAQTQEPSKLTGLVEDSAGWKVLNGRVSVRLAGQKKVVATTITNHKGVFTLSNLEPRTYDICFASTGLVGICQTSVVIKPGLNDLGSTRLQRDLQDGMIMESPAPRP